jgi:NADP-dependent 3-hydroxy acid dehydrogenase YdfG
VSAEKPLAGRRALVTGGTRGIGAATARALVAAGAAVGVVGRRGDDAVAVAKTLGPGSAAFAADLTDAKGIEGVILGVTDWSGSAPDIIVNNAGVFPHAALESQDPDELSRALRLNIEAPFALIRAFLPAMRARGSGDVVSIGSVADRNAFTGNAAYSATKYGIRGVHEVLRAETRGSGVRAILVSPGAVDTEIWEPYESSLGGRFPTRDAMLTADDVARAIVFAVSAPPHVDVEELRLTRS